MKMGEKHPALDHAAERDFHVALGDQGHSWALPVSSWCSGSSSSVTTIPKHLLWTVHQDGHTHYSIPPPMPAGIQFWYCPDFISENIETQEAIVTSHSHTAAQRLGQG